MLRTITVALGLLSRASTGSISSSTSPSWKSPTKRADPWTTDRPGFAIREAGTFFILGLTAGHLTQPGLQSIAPTSARRRCN